MKHLDLFSGIGGFALAASRVWPNHEIVGFCEKDEYCQKVLAKHWPGVPIHEDIYELVDTTANPCHNGEKGDCYGKQTTEVSGRSEAVRQRNVCSGDSYIPPNHQTGHVDDIETKGLPVPTQQEIREGQPLLQGDDSKRQGAKSTGNRHPEGIGSTEVALPGMRRHRNIQGREDEDPSTSYGLQQAAKSRLVVPEMSPQLAQGKQSIGGLDGKIDLITAGVPCQPASTAGKRRGADDDRWLWPETLKIIQHLMPTWVVLENVRGFTSLEQGVEFERVLVTLEEYGYEVQSFIIPACGVDAPHRRDRVWIVANMPSKRLEGATREVIQGRVSGLASICQNVADTDQHRTQRSEPEQAGCGSGVDGCGETNNVADTEELHSNGSNSEPRRKVSESGDCGGQDRREWPAEPPVGRVAHGIPKRVDRLKALGNAIVPACVQPIFEAIKLCPTQTQ